LGQRRTPKGSGKRRDGFRICIREKKKKGESAMPSLDVSEGQVELKNAGTKKDIRKASSSLGGRASF